MLVNKNKYIRIQINAVFNMKIPKKLLLFDIISQNGLMNYKLDITTKVGVVIFNQNSFNVW